MSNPSESLPSRVHTETHRSSFVIPCIAVLLSLAPAIVAAAPRTSESKVTVTSAVGTAVAGSKVRAYAESGADLGMARVTDAKGQALFRLAAGMRVYFTETSQGFTHRSAVITTPGETTIRLPEATRVTVLKDAGGPFAGITVTVYEELLDGSQVVRARPVTDAQGAVTVLAPVGTRLQFRARVDKQNYATQVVTAPASATILVYPDTFVTVTRAGTPVAGEPVQLYSEAGVNLNTQVKTDETGAARFVIARGERVRFQVKVDGVILKTEVVTTPARATIAIPGYTVVRVTRAGVAVPNLAVSLLSETGSNLHKTIKTDARGEARYLLPSGQRVMFQVTVEKVIFRSTVVTAPSPALIAIPKDTTVRVLVLGSTTTPVQNQLVNAYTRAGSLVTKDKTGKDGTVQFVLTIGEFRFSTMWKKKVYWSPVISASMTVIIWVGDEKNPPSITNLLPHAGSKIATLLPTIGASYRDAQSGVNIDTVHLSLDGAEVIASSTVTSSQVTYDPANPITEGAHTASVSVADTQGNQTRTTWSFIADVTPPTTTNNADAAWHNASVTVTLTATDNLTGAASTRYQLDGGAEHSGASVTVNTEGTHTITYWSTDGAGNVEEAKRAVVRIDKTSPVLSNLIPTEGALLGTTTPTMSVAYSDALSGVNAASVSLQLDGVDVTAQATVSAAGVAFTPEAPIEDGAHTLAVQVADAAGNVASTGWTFQTDTTAPVVAVTNPADGSETDQETITVSGTAVDTHLQSVTVNGQPATVTDTAWRIQGVALTIGENVLTVIATDSLGHASTAGARVTRVGGSEIFSVSPTRGSMQGGTMVTVSGKNLRPSTVITVGGTLLQNPVVTANSVTGVVPASAAAGPSDVVARDDTGWTATLPRAFTFVTVHTIALTGPADAALLAANSVDVAGTVAGGVEPYHVTVSVNQSVVAQTAIAGPGAFSLTTPLQEGYNQVTVTMSDSDTPPRETTVTRSVTRDTTPPPPPGIVVAWEGSMEVGIAWTGDTAAEPSVCLVGLSTLLSSTPIVVYEGPMPEGGARVEALDGVPCKLTLCAQDAAGNCSAWVESEWLTPKTLANIHPAVREVERRSMVKTGAKTRNAWPPAEFGTVAELTKVREALASLAPGILIPGDIEQPRQPPLNPDLPAGNSDYVLATTPPDTTVTLTGLGEVFTDKNSDGILDPGELICDLNGNGVYDPDLTWSDVPHNVVTWNNVKEVLDWNEILSWWRKCTLVGESVASPAMGTYSRSTRWQVTPTAMLPTAVSFELGDTVISVMRVGQAYGATYSQAWSAAKSAFEGSGRPSAYGDAGAQLHIIVHNSVEPLTYSDPPGAHSYVSAWGITYSITRTWPAAQGIRLFFAPMFGVGEPGEQAIFSETTVDNAFTFMPNYPDITCEAAHYQMSWFFYGRDSCVYADMPPSEAELIDVRMTRADGCEAPHVLTIGQDEEFIVLAKYRITLGSSVMEYEIPVPLDPSSSGENFLNAQGQFIATTLGKVELTTVAGRTGPHATTLDVYIVKVDLQVQGVPDATENTVGGLIMWNVDRDEDNRGSPLATPANAPLLDYEEDYAHEGHRIVSGDDEVLHASVTIGGPAEMTGSLTFAFPEKVCLFTPDGSGFSEIISGQAYNVTIPQGGLVWQLRIESIQPSTARNDISVQVSFVPTATQFTCGDEVKLTSIVGDLKITEIRPVQVIENVPLVAEKATLVRAFVEWTSPISVLSDGARLDGVCVRLAGNPAITSEPMFCFKFGGKTYPSSIKYDPAYYQGNPQKYFMYNWGGSINAGPFSPKSIGTVTYAVTADSDNKFMESDETNNSCSVENIKVKPFKYTQYRMLWKAVKRTSDPPFTLPTTARRDDQFLHMLSTYPIPASRCFRDVAPEVGEIPSLQPLTSTLIDLSIFTRLNNYQRGVYFLPKDVLGRTVEGISYIGNSLAVFIDEISGPEVVSHEIGHTYGFKEEYDANGNSIIPSDFEYGGFWDATMYPHGFVAADGWDVLMARPFPASGARISMNRVDPRTLEYNHFSFMGKDNGSWITRENYLTLMDALVTDGHDPRLLLIGGVIDDDGVVSLRPSFTSTGLESETSPGDYTVSCLDQTGTTLHQLRFGGLPWKDASGKKILPFALALEYPDATTKVTISKGPHTLCELRQSAHSPTVAIKDLRMVGSAWILSLEVGDLDGDSCDINVAYSANGGGNWMTLASGKADTLASITVSDSSLPGSQSGQLRVLASDGLNTTVSYVGLAVADKAPKVRLTAVVRCDDGSTRYEIVGYDLEDGFLPDNSIRWTDGGRTILGRGPSFRRPSDTHTDIVVRVTDSRGNTSALKVPAH